MHGRLMSQLLHRSAAVQDESLSELFALAAAYACWTVVKKIASRRQMEGSAVFGYCQSSKLCLLHPTIWNVAFNYE